MTSSAEVIVLSSSPNPSPRTPMRAVCDSKKMLGISPRGESPPSLPSPSELFNPPSRSRYFPTPEVTDVAAKKKKGVAKKPVTPACPVKNDAVKPKPSTTKKESKAGTSKNIDTGAQGTANSGAKKSKTDRKGRTATSKKKETGNMTLTGKVTKGGTEAQGKKPSNRKKKVTEENERPDEPGSITLQGPAAEAENVELHLDEALRRRMDWTPPRDTSPKLVPTAEDERVATESSQQNTKGGFDGLLSSFSYSGDPSAVPEGLPNVDGGGPTKRRRIDLVNPLVQPLKPYQTDSNGEASDQGTDSSGSGPKPKKKSKGPKRLTTLTARMTAQYNLSNTTHDESPSDEPQTTRKVISKRAKGKLAENEALFTVLSPEAAFRSLEDQDLVFGTCSQLEREDSPQTWREMQQAISASETLALGRSTQVACANSISKDPKSYLPGTRDLWRVAARSPEGSLVQARIVNGSKQPNSGVVPSESAQTKRSLNWQDDDWFDLDYGKPQPSPKKKKSSLPETISKPNNRPIPLGDPKPMAQADQVSAKVAPTQEAASDQPQMPHYSGFTDAELTKQVAAFGFKSVRGRKKMIELLQKCWESKHRSSNTTRSLVQSQPQPQSQTQKIDHYNLSKASQSQTDDLTTPAEADRPTTRPKSQSKKKTASISDTNSCITKKTTQKDVLACAGSKKSPKKTEISARALPSSFADVEEIQDSEDETAPSPSQVQKRYRDMLPQTSELRLEPTLSPEKRKRTGAKSTVTAKSTSTTLTKSVNTVSSKRSSLPDLASQITKAVRSQHLLSPISSSSGSRSRPTWHEKILMYDPVILEDFTTWLNVEGLGLVGEDREVHVAAAREWCESKGICCCWKNNASW